MSRHWTSFVLLSAMFFMVLPAHVNAADPYYLFIKACNPKLSDRMIAKVINLNKQWSVKTGVDMDWHMAKTAHETGFRSIVGDSFYGDAREACYGVEAIQIPTAQGYWPKSSRLEIQYRLQHDWAFAIETSYRLDKSNLVEAAEIPELKTLYATHVAALITYNCGYKGFVNRQWNLIRYLRAGKLIENFCADDWIRYRMNFREIYSINFYIQILIQKRELERLKKLYPPLAPVATVGIKK